MVNSNRIRLPIVFIILLILILVLGTGVSAAKDLVVDQADKFTAAEESQLEKAVADLGAQYGMDIVIVTADNAGGKTAMAYADDFFDYNGYGIGDNRDGILMLMDFENRDVWISTSGSGIRYLTDARIESILDAIFAGGMTSGDYFGAAQAFVRSTSTFLQAGIPSDQYNDPGTAANSLTPVEGLISLLASGILGVGIFGGVRSSYKGKNNRPIFEYQKNSLVNMGIVTDNLMNTFVTSRIIPRNTGSSGGSGRSSTHTSSSGGTHGGGGRGF
jgi:uncharacterized protein